MKVQILGKNITITEAMTNQIEKKLSFLEKFFLIDGDTTAKVLIKVHNHEQKIEVTIPTKVATLRAISSDRDLYNAIDKVIDKLEDQIRRQKTRLEKNHKEKLAKAFIEEEFEYEVDEVVKTKTINLETLDLEDAIMKMEMLGHDFFVYKDLESQTVAIVYRRYDGGYGLLETE